MTRVLKRPMFRIGGPANEGITSGLAPRQGYQGTDDASDQRVLGDWLRTATMGDIDKYVKQRRYQPRGTNVYDFLTEFGLDIASRPPQGSIFSTAAAAAKEPFGRFQARDVAQKDREWEKKLYDEKMDFEREKFCSYANKLGG